MSKGNTPTESLFKVRDAEKNNKKEEQLRDYPIKVDGDEIFYTVPFQSDQMDRSSAGLFARGMTSHFRDIGDTNDGDVFLGPRHCLLPYMTHRGDIKDADTSWDVWRVRMIDGVRFREFIGTLIGIKLAKKSEFKYPNGRERWETIDPRWKGVPVITHESFLHSKVRKLVTIADTMFPNKGKRGVNPGQSRKK
jgi:hypothetical protein